MVLTLAVQQCWQVGGELRAIHARFSSGLTRQSDEQRQHRPAERRWCMGGRAANEADAIGAILDALVQGCLPGDLARELRDVDAQPIGRVQASVSWCSVTVNREVLQRLLNQAQDVEKEIATVDRMLRLGASTEMVSRFYGLTHQEVALRREILGLPKRKGRHPVLDETQDTELWRQWKAVTSSRNVDLEDETSILDAAMDLAEGMSLPLSVVWAAIRNWVDQGLD